MEDESLFLTTLISSPLLYKIHPDAWGEIIDTFPSAKEIGFGEKAIFIPKQRFDKKQKL